MYVEVIANVMFLRQSVYVCTIYMYLGIIIIILKIYSTPIT